MVSTGDVIQRNTGIVISDSSVSSFAHITFATLQMRRELGPKCVLVLFLGSFL